MCNIYGLSIVESVHISVKEVVDGNEYFVTVKNVAGYEIQLYCFSDLSMAVSKGNEYAKFFGHMLPKVKPNKYITQKDIDEVYRTVLQ